MGTTGLLPTWFGEIVALLPLVATLLSVALAQRRETDRRDRPPP